MSRSTVTATSDQYDNSYLSDHYMQALGYAWGWNDAGGAKVDSTAWGNFWVAIMRESTIGNTSRPAIQDAFKAFLAL